MLVHGGFDGDTALSDTYILDIDDRRWQHLPDLFPRARAGSNGKMSEGSVLIGRSENPLPLMSAKSCVSIM